MVPLTLATASRIAQIVIAVTMLLASAAGSFFYFSKTEKPPIKYLSIAVLNKDMRPGDVLHGRVTFDRYYNCPATSVRSVLKIHHNGTDSEEIVYTDVVNQVSSAVGEGVNLLFSVPLTKLEDGTYVLRIVGRHDCNGKIWTIELPSAGFNIVKE